jgi:hypothetical protein
LYAVLPRLVLESLPDALPRELGDYMTFIFGEEFYAKFVDTGVLSIGVIQLMHKLL